METQQLILLLFFFLLHLTTSNGLEVNPTLVQSDTGAVCLTGKPASYYFFQGFGKGIHNWIVYLPGGGWCATPGHCIIYAESHNMSLDPRPFYFGHILSNEKKINPDFYDWNKVAITYCDDSSFTGDSQKNHIGTNLYFRGARIFDAVMKELLQKGMGMARNTLLFGGSAGGVATTLHCDGFRNLLPHAIREKIRSNSFTPTFEGLIALHGSTKSLPKKCTSRLSPHLCFFAQNVQQDIQTPIFFLMFAFDTYQVSWTFKHNETIKSCIVNVNDCSCEIYKVLQDLRQEFLSLLPNQMNSSAKGVLITSPAAHGQETSKNWNLDMVIEGSNETIAKLFRDWYFDKRGVYIIDKYLYPFPNNCSAVTNNSLT